MKHNDTPCQGDTPTLISIIEVRTLTIMHSVFFVMAGLIVEMLFMLFSIYNRLKMSDYEAYRLTDTPPIFCWACAKK